MAVINLINLTKKAGEEKTKFFEFLGRLEEKIRQDGYVYTKEEKNGKDVFKLLDVEFYFNLYLYDFKYNYDYTKVKMIRIYRDLNGGIKEEEEMYSEFFEVLENEEERIIGELLATVEKKINSEHDIKIY